MNVSPSISSNSGLLFSHSLHLYHILPNAKLGQLASYRTVLIKNKHLAVLAQKLKMDKFLLKGVGDSSEYPSTKTEEPLSPPNDPCSSSSCSISTTSGAATAMDSASHTVANTLEAVVGAVYLDGGLKAAQQLTARLFFPEDVCMSPTLVRLLYSVLIVTSGPLLSLDGVST